LIATLTVDGCMGYQIWYIEDAPRPILAVLNVQPINGQCTDLILFDLPLHVKGLSENQKG